MKLCAHTGEVLAITVHAKSLDLGRSIRVLGALVAA